MKTEPKPIVFIGSNSIIKDGISFCINKIMGYNNIVSYKSIDEALKAIDKVDIIIIDLMSYESSSRLKKIKKLIQRYSILLLVINADDLLVNAQFFDVNTTVFIDCNYLYRDLKNAFAKSKKIITKNN